MTETSAALKLRAKIFGALIREARIEKGVETDKCAEAIGISTGVFEQYELGELTISLPELEGLAFFLEIPVEDFLMEKADFSDKKDKKYPEMSRIIALRHRMVGAQLREARQAIDLDLESAARQAGLEAADLEAYELGNAIPLPQMELLCGIYRRSVKEFLDQHGPVGAWTLQQKAARHFRDLPVDLQEFISKPINRPYLELAQRLSEISVERLRTLAEGLLEITY